MKGIVQTTTNYFLKFIYFKKTYQYIQFSLVYSQYMIGLSQNYFRVRLE